MATTKGIERNPVIGDLAISTDISNVIIDADPDVKSEYVGPVCWAMQAEKDERGIPIPPKSMLEIEGRQDAPMWWDSAEQEWEGLDDRGCFEHDITRGAPSWPLPLPFALPPSVVFSSTALRYKQHRRR